MSSRPGYGLVVIAASAGGIPALRQVLSSLPAGFALPVAVVQHRTTRMRDLLPGVLARWSTLPVKPAAAGQPILPGTVYVARPDVHLIVNPDRTFGMTDGRKIRFVRSSANPLLTSAARELGPIIGVVLSGSGSDASDGVQAVKSAAGVVLVQDEATAQYYGMPSAAISTRVVDRVLPIDRIGLALVELAGGDGAFRNRNQEGVLS
jgi:two-component system chemotaxis response regulator CheB